jgi:uncharacterized protein YndB with AHSA1/START domain
MTESAAEQQQRPLALRVERTYDAPAQAVFDAWTSPEVLRRWFHAGDENWSNTAAEVDLRVGGSYRMTMRNPDGTEHTGSGEYTEVTPPHRLAFTWTWAHEDSPDTLVEVDFTERDGATTVVLTHTGVTDAASQDSHTSGWEQVLESLAREMGGRR